MQSRSIATLGVCPFLSRLRYDARKQCQKECALLPSEAMNHFSPDSPGHHSSFFLMVSKALSKRAFIQTIFFIYIPILDWIRDTGNRKENNQFHESLHAQFCLCTPSISPIFHCQSQLSWQRHKGFISQYHAPVSKIQKAWWSDEKNCIHALKPRSAGLPYKHTQWCVSPILV